MMELQYVLHSTITRLILAGCLYLFILDLKSINSQYAARIPGDLILGGIVPVHEKGKADKACGKVNVERGIQRLEAMLFAIDLINNNKSLLTNITLGANILDSCSSETYALNQSLEFVRASMSALDETEFECDDGSRAQAKNSPKPVVGVIGGSYSTVSTQIANLLRLFKIPQISPASTSASFSDKKRFDYFARTVPPDSFQAAAMVDIVQRFNWTYVSVVASGGEYGESGIDFFQKEAEKRNICIATREKISNNLPQVYDEIIKNLRKKPNAKGVILFLAVDDAENFLEAVKRANCTEEFVWIASDGWGSLDRPVAGKKAYAEGAITIELQSNLVAEFDDYMLNLNPNAELTKRNPWFKEFWEEKFNCTLDYEHLENKNISTKPCNGTESLLKHGYKQESKVPFVINAVYAMAYALHNMHRDLCPNTTEVCPAMQRIDGHALYTTYLLNVSFTVSLEYPHNQSMKPDPSRDLTGGLVKFDEKGDGLPRYNIMNYQKNLTTMEYEYRKVGEWGYELMLDVDTIIFSGGKKTIPLSQCSLPCGYGEIKNTQQGETCCWICTKCDPWEYLLDEFTCEDCGHGRWPYPHKLSCFDLEEEYLHWNSVYAIVPMCISCLGFLITASIIGVFIRNNDTPIVKASGRELSYMLLTGIMLCYLMTFALLAKPTSEICGLQRFGVGFSFSMMYAALLTKTNRISRIFDSASRSARRPGFISPKSQVIITLILISVQVVGTAIWLVIEPPGIRHYYPDGKRDKVILKCKIEDSSFLISLVYNMLLVITCTVYAVKTRKIPENFNESKFIGFTMYTTCIIWLAFVPIYFGTGNSFQVQITTLCIAVSLSATVALLCLYSPKIYIIVFQPEKNVRKLTMNSAQYKKAPTSSTCGTSTANHGSGSVEQIKLNVQGSPNRGQESDRDSMASL